jgi:hypothetical protein
VTSLKKKIDDHMKNAMGAQSSSAEAQKRQSVKDDGMAVAFINV